MNKGSLWVLLTLQMHQLYYLQCCILVINFRYFRINLLRVTVPSSEKHFKPYPELVSRKSSIVCAKSLCRVDEILAQGQEFKTRKNTSLHIFPNQQSWIIGWIWKIQSYNKPPEIIHAKWIGQAAMMLIVEMGRWGTL